MGLVRRQSTTVVCGRMHACTYACVCVLEDHKLDAIIIARRFFHRISLVNHLPNVRLSS